MLAQWNIHASEYSTSARQPDNTLAVVTRSLGYGTVMSKNYPELEDNDVTAAIVQRSPTSVARICPHYLTSCSS